MAKRRKSGISTKTMWYVMYGIAGYFAYTYWSQMQSLPQIPTQPEPPAASLP